MEVMKQLRQRAIRQLVATRPVGSQRELVDALIAQGFDADGNTPEQFTEVIRRDLARWQKVIAEAKIRVE